MKPLTLTNPILDIVNLSGGYGDTQVLKDICVSVEPGEVLGVTGRNGVGKTTLIRHITGELAPRAGTVKWRGQPWGTKAPHLRKRDGLACMPQERLIFDNLSVQENLVLHRTDRSLTPMAALLERFARVRERLELSAGRMSGGEKKLVAFVRTISDEASLTLLDEPTEGVQQENIALMVESIHERVRDGAAFVIVEQNFSMLAQVANRVIVLDHGEIIHRGPCGPEQEAELRDVLAL